MTQPVPQIAVVVDTSASMSPRDLARAKAEIDSLLSRVVPGHAIRTLSVDTEVAADSRITSTRRLRLTGGGGTDMGAGITAAATSRPVAIIVITDGYTPWPANRPQGAGTVIAALVDDQAPIDGVPTWIRAIRVE